MSASQITFVLFAYGVIGFMSNFVVSSFIGERLKGGLTILIMLMAVAMLTLLMFGHKSVMVIGGVMIWGIAFGAMPLCLSLWNRNAADGQVEAASGMFAFTTQSAIAVGSLAGGVFVDHVGLSSTFWFGAALLMMGLIAVLGQREHSPQGCLAD